MRGRVRIGDDQVVELAEMFRLMSDPTRLRIILACLDAPAAVGEMAERLGISASLVSHHLRLLRAARLLGAERRGRQVFYVVGDLHIRSMLSDMVDHVAEEDAETEAAPLRSCIERAETRAAAGTAACDSAPRAHLSSTAPRAYGPPAPTAQSASDRASVG